MVKTIYRSLIVDDESLIREATSRAMSAHAFDCDTASDGREALQLYRDQRHDLVVTDLRMPNYHGHSLILELLKDREPPRIVVLTGVANSRLVRELYFRGVKDIVEKPIDFQVFASKMMAMFEFGDWDPTIGQGHQIAPTGACPPHIHQLEKALEIFSLCIPKKLESALSGNRDLLTDPPANLVQFLERLTAQCQANSERRTAARIPVLASAIAIPVSKDFEIKGPASTVTIHNLSESGTSLFHTRSFPTDYVALRWRSLVKPKLFMQAVVQVTRCKPMGPFYEVAGSFVMHD